MVPSSKLGHGIVYPSVIFLKFSSMPSIRCQENILEWASTSFSVHYPLHSKNFKICVRYPGVTPSAIKSVHAYLNGGLSHISSLVSNESRDKKFNLYSLHRVFLKEQRFTVFLLRYKLNYILFTPKSVIKFLKVILLFCIPHMNTSQQYLFPETCHNTQYYASLQFFINGSSSPFIAQASYLVL